MWGIRILSGPQAGHVFPTKPGKYILGRGPSCEIKINSTSVSKEHATILVTEDGKVIVTDLSSRNGTFVNGVRVQNQLLSLGDKIGLHDILLDLVKVPDTVSVSSFQAIGSKGRSMQHAPQRAAQSPAQGPQAPPQMPAWAGNAAMRLQEHEQAPAMGQPIGHSMGDAMSHGHADLGHDLHTPEAPASNSLAGLSEKAKEYFESVVMPGVYRVAQAMPFRFALIGLVAIYVLAVTTLSIIPMVQTTQKNIQSESIRRVRSIARNVRDIYKRSAMERSEHSTIDLQSARLEEGVTDVFIINAKDGTVIAPVNIRGEFVNKPFVNKARREERELTQFIDDTNIGSSIPIVSYSADTGSQAVVAYAIVLYDSGAQALNGGQTLSLFIQTLFIALVAGAVLFIFLARVVEHPIDSLNHHLDDALREGRDDLRTPYQFPAIEKLVSNINSALSRMGQPGSEVPAMGVMHKDQEAANLVAMLPIACVAINAIDDRIIATNTDFDRLVGGGLNLSGRPVTAIPDPALPLSLQDLIDRVRANPAETAQNTLRFSNGPYAISAQAVMGGSDPAYFLFTLVPAGGEG